MKFLTRTLAAAATLFTLAAGPALADQDTFVFRVAETQLSSQSDAERAYQRLSAEAERYCLALDIDAISARAECRLDVVENVVEAVGDARLDQVHRTRIGARTLADAG